MTFSVNNAKKDREMGSMGEGALKSHANGDKRRDLVAAEESRLRFFAPHQRIQRHDEQSGEPSSSSESAQDSGKNGTKKGTADGQQNIYKVVSKASSGDPMDTFLCKTQF